MADEPAAVPGPDEEAKEQEKKRKSPKPKFGQILDLGGQYWTIQSSGDGRVTVSRRVGDTVDTRTINEKEYESAATRPLPGNLRSSKAPKGVAIDSYVQIPGGQGGAMGRVASYDAVTGEMQVEQSGGEIAWISSGQGAAAASRPSRPGKAGAGEGGLVDRWVRRQVSDLTYGAVSPTTKPKKQAKQSLSKEKKPLKKKGEEEDEEEDEVIVKSPTITVERHDAEKDDYLIALRDPETGEIERRWVDGTFARVNLRRVIGAQAGVSPGGTALRTAEMLAISQHINPRLVTKEDVASLKKEEEPKRPTTEPVARRQQAQAPVSPAAAPIAAAAPAVVASRIIPVGGVSLAPPSSPSVPSPASVRVSRTVPVGQAPKASSIRETRVQLKTQVERAKSAPTPTGIKATVSVPTASATPAAAALGVAGAALGAMTAGTVQASQAAATEQQTLYAKAMHALDVVSARAAEKRGSIRNLQTQADGLRREVSGLNAQAAAPATGGAYRPPDVSGRIQQVSTRLGSVQNMLAMARYGLQTDEAQAQQLRIATNLMKNLAPEVQRGQVPNSIVGLVAQSIPPDVPDPSPQRAVALIATLQPGVTAPPSKAPTATAARPTPPSTTGLPESVRARMSRGGLTLPQATAVAFSAGQQADRAAGGYREGVGSPDAREAAFATAGAGARPVIDTIAKSYSDAEAPEAAEDFFSSGGEGASADFTRRQRESSATQEQFLPGTTGGPEATTFAPEAMRAQRIRPGEEGPDEEALRAAKFSADQARTRAAALQVLDVSEEEETRLNLSRKQQAFKQLESAKRNFSHLIDLFNTAHGLIDVIGIFAVLANMNMRVLTIKFRKGSMTRKFFPPAQFPIEAAGIVAIDIILFTVVFVSFCIAIAPFIIFWTIVGTGIGGLIYAVTSIAS